MRQNGYFKAEKIHFSSEKGPKNIFSPIFWGFDNSSQYWYGKGVKNTLTFCLCLFLNLDHGSGQVWWHLIMMILLQIKYIRTCYCFDVWRARSLIIDMSLIRWSGQVKPLINQSETSMMAPRPMRGAHHNPLRRDKEGKLWTMSN